MKRNRLYVFLLCLTLVFGVGCSPSQTYLDMCREEIQQDQYKFVSILEEAIKNKNLTQEDFNRIVEISDKYRDKDFPPHLLQIKTELRLNKYEENIVRDFLIFANYNGNISEITSTGLKIKLDLTKEYAMEKVK